MLDRARVVYRKELLTLARDRRLILSVTVISLVVMPALMGFLGNIDRLTGAEQAVIELVASDVPAELLDRIARETNVRVVAAATDGERVLTLVRNGDVIEVGSDGTSRQLRRRADEVHALLLTVRDEEIERRLGEHGLAMATLQPFQVEQVDTAPVELQATRRLALMVPYLAVLLLVGNAVRATYIAVGEKEKRTLASLLVADVPRSSIVLGKVLAIATFTVSSSVLLVIGMMAFAKAGFTISADDTAAATLAGGQMLQLGLNLAALALLIATIVMLIGTYARSQREAAMYNGPLVLLSIGAAVMTFSSSQFGPLAYLTPVLGNALALKETFLGTLTSAQLLLPIAGNLLLATVAVAAAVRLYGKESVMFPG